MSGWNLTVVNKTAKSIGITWSPPPILLDGGIRFYVAVAKKVNSGESSAEIMPNNTGVIEIIGLLGNTEYNVSVVAVDGYGIPFKSTDVIVMTDEGGEIHYNSNWFLTEKETSKQCSEHFNVICF